MLWSVVRTPASIMPETHFIVSHFHEFATNCYETSTVCYIRQDKLIYEEGFLFPKNCLYFVRHDHIDLTLAIVHFTFVTLVSFNKKNANA